MIEKYLTQNDLVGSHHKNYGGDTSSKFINDDSKELSQMDPSVDNKYSQIKSPRFDTDFEKVFGK